MSGDVQPRKRKDKRRKRDDRKSDGDVTVLRQSSFQDDDESSHGVHITKMGNDDVHLHVHHEHGTGGNWCAKIIFFSLMAVLLGLVGLIILENRGLEDMDTPLSESRFSNYFNGLVDEHRGEHDAHDVHKPSGEALDEHDDHDEHDEHDDHDEEEEPLSEELEEEDEEEEEEEATEEEAATEQEEDTEQEDKTEQEEDEDEDEEEVEEEQEEDDDEEEEDNNAGENITAEEPEEDELDDDNTAEPSVEATTEATVEATAEYDVEDPDEDEPEDDDEDDVPESQEPNPTTAELDEDKTDDNDEAEEEEIKESVQWKAQESTPKKVTTKYYKVTDDDEHKYDDDDDDFESLDEDPEELARQVRRANAADSEEQQQDNDKEEPKEEGSSWLASQIKPKEVPASVPASAPASSPAPAAEDSFQQELRQANAEMIRENYVQALRSFNTLIQHYADEPLAHLGHARLLERLAEKERSNQRLWQAIDAYKRYLAFGELVASDGEFLSAGERCIQNLRFMGYHQQSVNIHELLIERLPADPRLRNQLSFTHLTANNMRQMKLVAAATLKLWPDDPVAQLHFGLAIKQLHGDYEQALPYLQNAIASRAEGTQEGYFYLALGETLQRLSRQPEAVEVHRQGVARGLIPSVYQRSLYNEPQLRAQPFWQPSETGYASQLRKLQENWMSIRKEALALLNHRGYFADETENLRHKGIWQQFELFAKGQLHGKNCQRAPITCGLMKAFPESSGCRRGQVKFSVMQAETHVWPHCGPTNCRLRAHLTLVAPEPERTSLRVAEQEITWREGELIIFDDSFEHEVWHNGTRPRLVLIVDMWHPDLTATQRRTLTAI
ncbi:aspartyl/asparaginyl beta-hydroxylase isoform X2 [Drosophila subobscura]|uniref:aspartyl/asparaginyl beta-hydroxylase isoform X2 n=1 Tax=Drosophila subobscura TaxID=7241 RepID=UPI00155B2D19|nr:aspartyl/asparaginyl beta-hydroxylase isoform X2 [Drosophila subobscura]